MSKFEVVETTTGAKSIRNNEVGEIMHNPVGPWLEANALYIEQSSLYNRLKTQDPTEEFVIFDVGLGAAANSIAALSCAKNINQCPPLKLISFERDLELLEFALEHAGEFDHFRGFEEAIDTLLKNHVWEEGNISWQLRAGDFNELIQVEKHKAHLVFFDPYSPNVNQEMWTLSSFKNLRTACHESLCDLYTYSRATRIRAAMIIAGFYVGQGESTGLKDETTEASTSLTRLKNPLGEAWYQRWQRSHLRDPFDAQPDQKEELDQAIHLYMEKILKH